MLIDEEELYQIADYYRIDGDAYCVGYQWVDPDTVWYYFRDEEGNFYILEASDYIMWVCGHGEPPKELRAENQAPFPVEKWLTCHDGLMEDNECGDKEGYIYWADNSDRCVMAKIKGTIYDYKTENIDINIPEYNKVAVLTYAKERIAREAISEIPRPRWQSIAMLEQNICNVIQAEIMAMAEHLTAIELGDITEEMLTTYNRDLFIYAQTWSENGGSDSEGRLITDLNNQSWLALCEKRDFSDHFEERKAFLYLLKRYLKIVNAESELSFLPRETVYNIMNKFDLKYENNFFFKTMKEFAEDCKIYLFEGESGSEYVLVCRNIEQNDIEQEKTLLKSDFDIIIDKFFNLKDNPETYHYVCRASEVSGSGDEKYYFAVGRKAY